MKQRLSRPRSDGRKAAHVDTPEAETPHGERGAIAASGKSPLEVMLLAMEAHLAAGELDEAAAWAKDAAPYLHPKLSTVAPGGGSGDTGAGGEALSNRRLAMAILALLREAATEAGETGWSPDPTASDGPDGGPDRQG